MPKLQISPKLLALMKKKKRFKILIGGRGGMKTMTVADLCIMDAQTKGIKTACLREYQNSIDDSVFTVLKTEIERLKAEGFVVMNNEIRYLGEPVFKFKGLARNVESAIKGMHGFNRFWVEEAQTMSDESIKVLIPTLREEGSEIWMTANLRSMADPFAQRFFKPFERELRGKKYYEDDLHLIIWVNLDDNPFAVDTMRKDRDFDRNNMSAAMFRHVWEGEPYDEVMDSIVSVEVFEAAIDAHIKLGFKAEGAVISAFDPADEGGDAKGFAARKGSVVLDVCEYSKGDAADGMDWALKEARKHGTDYFVWDCDGLGAGLKRQVDQELQGKEEKIMFKGSESPEGKEQLFNGGPKTIGDLILNKRAQNYKELLERFENTYKAVVKKEYISPDSLISIPSTIKNLDQLRAEVCRLPRKFNHSGKFQMLSKIEMRQKPYELSSPNMADALMMTMIKPKPVYSAMAINYGGWQ
jgi:phage terminase large subunit